MALLLEGLPEEMSTHTDDRICGLFEAYIALVAAAIAALVCTPFVSRTSTGRHQ